LNNLGLEFDKEEIKQEEAQVAEEAQVVTNRSKKTKKKKRVGMPMSNDPLSGGFNDEQQLENPGYNYQQEENRLNKSK